MAIFLQALVIGIAGFLIGGALGGVLFIVLFILGVLIQGFTLRRDRAITAVD